MCRDESGGAIPGVTVTALEVRTNISRTAVSNEAGNYTFTNLASRRVPRRRRARGFPEVQP